MVTGGRSIGAVVCKRLQNNLNPHAQGPTIATLLQVLSCRLLQLCTKSRMASEFSENNLVSGEFLAHVLHEASTPLGAGGYHNHANAPVAWSGLFRSVWTIAWYINFGGELSTFSALEWIRCPYWSQLLTVTSIKIILCLTFLCCSEIRWEDRVL